MEIPTAFSSRSLFSFSSRPPPSRRIYTAGETANGSFFQPSFKEALKGTRRAFDGSEVSLPRGPEGWGEGSMETVLRQELTGEPLRKKNGTARLPRTGQNSSKRRGTMLRENVCRELLMIEEIREG